MTDILTKLAVLTSKQENGLPFCPLCGEKTIINAFKRSGEFGIQQTYYQPSCSACNFCDETLYTSWKLADESINRRPREDALIALVREAAAEIERLRKDYLLIHEQYNSTVDKLRQATKRINELDPPAPGWG